MIDWPTVFETFAMTLNMTVICIAMVLPVLLAVIGIASLAICGIRRGWW